VGSNPISSTKIQRSGPVQVRPFGKNEHLSDLRRGGSFWQSILQASTLQKAISFVLSVLADCPARSKYSGDRLNVSWLAQLL